MKTFRTAKIDSLTGLRFFAAMAIVVWHSQTGYFFKPGAFSPIYLAGAVPLFFALSGFVLTLNADPNRSWSDFFVARIARIWPAHAFAILFLFLIFAPYSVSLINNEDGVRKLILNALLLQAWFPDMATYWSYNAPSWSVSCELFFYVVFPMSLVFISARPVLSITAIVVTTVILVTAISEISPSVDPNWLGSMNPLSCFTGFAFGIGAGIWHERVPPNHVGYRMATALQLGVVLLVIAMNALSESVASTHLPSGLRMYIGVFGAAPFYALLLLALTRYAGAISELLSRRIIVYGGEISYSLYLFHQLIIRWHSGYRSMFHGIPMGVQWVGVVCASIVMACLSHHFVEKPGREIIGACWKRLRVSAVSQPEHM